MITYLVPEFALLGTLVAQSDALDRLSTVQSLTPSQFNLIYNAFSFAIAVTKTKIDQESGGSIVAENHADELKTMATSIEA